MKHRQGGTETLNKSESKYFNTAIKMDKAFLQLLEKKDFEYISIKEICEKAGVNRSTFYLHYDNTSDLLSESIRYMNEQFLSYFQAESVEIITKLKICPIEELILVEPKYLMPYLTYIKEHKKLFQTVISKPTSMNLEETYQRMFQRVFNPIMERFDFPVSERNYVMAFYINGIIAIIMEWVKSDCCDTIEQITDIIIKCVMPPNLRTWRKRNESRNLFR